MEEWNAKDVVGLKGSISLQGAEASGTIGGDRIDPKKFDDVYKDMGKDLGKDTGKDEGKLSIEELKEKALKDLPDVKFDDDDAAAEKKSGKTLKK